MKIGLLLLCLLQFFYNLRFCNMYLCLRDGTELVHSTVEDVIMSIVFPFDFICTQIELSSEVEGHLRLIGKVERRGSLTLSLGGINAKGEGIARNDRGQVLVLLSIVAAEVSLDDGDGLFVNVIVLVLLKAFDVIDAAGLIDKRDVSCNLVEGLASLEDGFESLESDSNDLGIGAVHDAANSLNGACLDEALNVLGGTTSANVGNDPSCFLPYLPLVVV